MNFKLLIFMLLLLVPFTYAAGTFPRVQVTAPTDGQVLQDSQNITFSWTTFNDDKTNRCELWSNFNGDLTAFSVNRTNNTLIADGTGNSLNIILPDGSYSYNFLCYDVVTSVYQSMKSFGNKTGIFDDVNYNAGLINNSTPNWIPQYPAARWVNITPWKTIRIDSIAEYQGDRDQHITLNRTEIPTSTRNLEAGFTFNVSQCNSTFKLTQGVNPIAASFYINYKDGNNFLDGEFKANSNNSLCNYTTSQFSMFKRVGGNSVALIPFTQYYLLSNRTYDVRILLFQVNSTVMNMTVWLNGTVLASSINISPSEIQDGSFLLESAGTVTEFDNITVNNIDFYDFQVNYLTTQYPAQVCDNTQSALSKIPELLPTVIPTVIILLMLAGLVGIIFFKDQLTDLVGSLSLMSLISYSIGLVVLLVFTILLIAVVGSFTACQ